jgi:predicted ATPase/DNA-binding SARP family transcriptional activator
VDKTNSVHVSAVHVRSAGPPVRKEKRINHAPLRPVTPTDTTAGPLTIRLFGPVEICLHGAPAGQLRTRRGGWLLALLTLRAGREVERAWLAGTLWPDSREAVSTLRRSLTDLRRILGPEADRLRTPTKQTLQMDLAGAFVDVLAFDAAVERGETSDLEQAVALYRGPLLEGCGDEWALPEREAREQAYLGALETLAAEALARGVTATAERWLRQVVAIDPLRESAQRALMQTLAAGGSYAAAVLTYRDLRLQLYREINSRPDPETQALFERLRREKRARAGGRRLLRGSSAKSGTDVASPAPAHNLPLPPTPLIGRESEVAAVRAILSSPEARLVTLTGPGGIGKTRLGLEAAAGLPEAFADGIHLVSLAPVRDPALVASTIAQALAVRERGGISEREIWPQLGQLKAHLREKQLLLLLDNFEHLLEAGPLVAELLAAAPRLKVLATSRAALRLRGEREFPVTPLAIPVIQASRPGTRSGGGYPRSGSCGRGESGANLSPWTSERLADLGRFAAVELFIQRAMDVKPDFQLTPENGPAVAALCHRLDGLPLAIELAAARIRLLSPPAMLLRLSQAGLARHRCAPAEQLPWEAAPGYAPRAPARVPGRSSGLQLLVGGAHDLPARQQTLRNTIGWSYDLLTEAEKILFRRLAVFVGGCALEAAEAVGDSGLPMPIPVLDLIESLVEKNLLRQEESGHREAAGNGGIRLWMLETIREFGQECLEASGEAEAVHRRHAEYYLALVEQRDEAESAWLDKLEREHDNLRAVLAWCLETVDSRQWSVVSSKLEPLTSLPTAHCSLPTASQPTVSDLVARLAMPMCRLWYLRGYWTEGRERLSALLASGALAADSPPRARLLCRAGQLAWLQGDYGAARSLLLESLTLFRALGNPEDLPAPLNALGEVARTQGDYALAQSLFAESRALLLAEGDRGNGAWALQALGETALEQGDVAAEGLLEESLALFREVGDRRGISYALSHLGEAARLHGELSRARTLQQESLTIQREAGQKAGTAMSLGYLARAMADAGEITAARSLYLECLALRRDLGDRRSIASCLEGIAGLVAGTGKAGTEHLAASPESAARFFGTAQALREAIGAPLPPVERPEHERRVAAVQELMDESAFAAAWAEGQVTPLDQTLSLLDRENDLSAGEFPGPRNNFR